MLEANDRVVVGISGGADSVCLLFVLLEWAKRVPLQLAVVHVNHGIRQEAVEDAAYVESLCKAHKIPFYLVEEDVARIADELKCSEEDAGRKVRYNAFSRVAEEWGAQKIAVAHNSNDRSETMLFHLFRGSGIKGLSSIQPVRDNIIRPILCLERAEIEQYLQEQGIAYCQDATNATDDYTRNRIRHHILPYAEQEIVQGCVQHMAQTAEQLSEVEDYLERQTAAAEKQCVEKVANAQGQCTQNKTDAYKVSVNTLLQYHPTIQKRVLHTLVKSLSPGHKDISYVHIQALMGLFAEQGNREICLPFGIRGRREYAVVYIERADTDKLTEALTEIFVELPKQPDAGECHEWTHTVSLKTDVKMTFRILARKDVFPVETSSEGENLSQKCRELAQNEYTKCFDYDKIKGYLTVRYRRTGDYLTLSDGNGKMIHKSLKDYMIAQKIPRWQRDTLSVLAEDSHILWLPGYRISEYYKISENTKRILQVQLIGEEFTEGETEENDGRTC